MNAAERRALIDRYRDGVQAVDKAISGATDAELDRRPAANEWSARDVAHHLADSETTSTIRLRRLLAEPDPIIHAYDEAEFARRLHYDRPIELSLAVFAAVRAANVELLGTLTEDEWGRSGTHTDDGSYSVERWLQIYADHGHDHADQIRRAREVVRVRRVLETFAAPPACTRVRFTSDELTSLCPLTGQPDFNSVEIDYAPNLLCIESKSLKLYLWSFRDKGAFCEQLAADIAAEVQAAIEPLRVRVTVTQHTRGGIVTEATAELPA